MDAIESDEKLDLDTWDLNKLKFVELKCIGDSKLGRIHEINYWAQCYLANIKKLIVGDRNENGIVKNLRHINVDDIPNQVGSLLF